MQLQLLSILAADHAAEQQPWKYENKTHNSVNAGKSLNINNIFHCISSKHFNLVYLFILSRKSLLTATEWVAVFHDGSVMRRMEPYLASNKDAEMSPSASGTRKSAKSRDVRPVSEHVASRQGKLSDHGCTSTETADIFNVHVGFVQFY